MNRHDRAFDRRTLLARGGALALAGALGGCGIKGSAQKNVEELTRLADEVRHPKTKIGTWTFATWPLYIDKKVVRQFDDKYGGHMKYIEEINDNNEFYGKVRPQLQAGRPIGRDAVVLTDPMASRWVQSGFVTPIDYNNVPNCKKNLVDGMREPPWDKGRRFSMPYQSGTLGLGYNIKKTGRELKSIKEFFNPEWKGRVTMLQDAQDTLSMILIGDGVDPSKADLDRHLEAAEKLETAQKAGQFRRFTGNDYSTDLTKGNITVALVYAGDMVQLSADNPDLRFTYPEEGAILWTDNMMMPANVQNPYAAEAWMNYLYEPEVAARVAAYVNYISPVKGVREIIAKKDPKLAENPLVFPPPEIEKKFFNYAALSTRDRAELDRTMSRVVGG